jgi:hypothetical protein
MACSSSKAQIVKLCELCEIETNLKWRCIQCDTILCDKCKKIHNKVQTNTQHQIVDLKIPFQDVEQKVILDNIRCDEHQTKMTCMGFFYIYHIKLYHIECTSILSLLLWIFLHLSHKIISH